MAEKDGQEQTEDATEKKLTQAKEKGQVVRSKELATTLVLTATGAAFLAFGDALARALVTNMTRLFQLTREEVFNPEVLIEIVKVSMKPLFWPLFGIMIIGFFAGIIGNIMMGGMVFSGESIRPKASKMSPKAGLKRMMGAQAMVELIKSIAKVAVVVTIALMVLKNEFLQIMEFSLQPLHISIIESLSFLTDVFIWLCASLIVIVAIDVPYQYWKHAKELRMTKQEVKDEMKDVNGNPQLKGKIRQMQMEVSQRRMMGNVPDADVIITNPTHYSVALKYDKSGSSAPTVVAKGVDQTAFRIREMAKANQVPILESAALTRAIYHTTEVDDPIPEGLFIAVAQILAYVYQLEQFKQRKGNRPKPLPKSMDIPDDLKY
ncbi:flagellar biosynthesis protein FlhB [Moritella sp. F3]|uniref:flagellar biosynthesis protein FlhB n=1 Tax=Moritella sp. F3 TaxID=2718882 RepID=UPI0018E0FD1D|nr:flagellar biosynthesis protein FlhB [Moritella sp. F3]GIC78041.1 flagellar biosynthesis protein FlhB [Moritella sp. F1]GIC82558.1 flagellar biosynthesis protein FlhB [Moritella sp. F3]